MNNVSLIDELDTAIDQMIAENRPTPAASAELAGLLEIADSLRALPRPNFKVQLSRELEWEASGRLVSNGKRSSRAAVPRPAVLTAIFGDGHGIYPVRRANFVASLTLHAAMIAFIGLGVLTVKNMPRVDEGKSARLDVDPFTMPPGTRQPNGGGGSTSHDKTAVSRERRPNAADVQIVPPILDTPPPAPKLAAEPTVVAPPMSLPNTQVGDQLSDLTRISGGVGGRSAAGTGEGTGVGSGSGAGYGPGSGGNYGGRAYLFGRRSDTAPRASHTTEPEVSQETRKNQPKGSGGLRC